MTEVHSSKKQGQGLFATKEYQPGEIILEESPLFTFQPKALQQIAKVRSQLKSLEKISTGAAANKKSTYDETSISSSSCLHDLIIPTNMKLNDCNLNQQQQRAKFLGMITAAATYATRKEQDDNINKEKDTILISKLNSLYAPSSSSQSKTSSSNNDQSNINLHEDNIIQLANHAIEYMKEHTATSSPLYNLVTESEEECKRIMLIWACNAFKGGNIYETTSRINHSCDFNAVVVSSSSSSSTVTSSTSKDNNEDDDDNVQIIRATGVIQPGEEIFISYLGSYTYAGMSIRKEHLANDKYFTCQCTRCQKEEDNGDVASAIPCCNCHERVGRYLDEDVQYDEADEADEEVNYAMPKKGSKHERCYSCQKCGNDCIIEFDSSVMDSIDKIIQKVVAHLDECGSTSPKDDDREELQEEMTERLLCLSYSVLGSKHWCTNLLLVQSLGRKLSAIHSSMLFSSTNKKNGKGKSKGGDIDSVDMADVAECVDSLQRLFSYIEGLKLQNSHLGHLLGNITIGVSRVLIGLGDVKSMKYGSEWVEKVNDYFNCNFEGPGMVKVVDTLLNAWKRKNDDSDSKESQSSSKRRRIDL